MSEHSEHIVSPGLYLVIFLALMLGTGLTVYAATVDLGRLNIVAALGMPGAGSLAWVKRDHPTYIGQVAQRRLAREAERVAEEYAVATAALIGMRVARQTLGKLLVLGAEALVHRL